MTDLAPLILDSIARIASVAVVALGVLFLLGVVVAAIASSKYALGPRADWWEPVRRTVWPALHGALELVGGYSLLTIGRDQYAATVPLDEERVERELASIGFHRNPVAALKRDVDGRVSRGSWVYREAESPVAFGLFFPPDFFAHWQLHVTLFDAPSGEIDLYAHHEYNPWRHPWKHLRANDLSALEGVDRLQAMLWTNDIQYRVRHEREFDARDDLAGVIDLADTDSTTGGTIDVDSEFPTMNSSIDLERAGEGDRGRE